MANEFMKASPYPGPRPFEIEDEALFFGRDREVRDLCSLILAHRLVLLHAQSGAGKTSLLNAGVIPWLARNEAFDVLPVARVGGAISKDIDTSKINNIYVFSALIKWAAEEDKVEKLMSMSIQSFLEERQRPTDEGGLAVPRLIVFDQLEELFTSYSAQWKEREGFCRQVAEAVKADSQLRVLFAIREDYLANLYAFSSLLPEALRTTIRLEPLQPRDACLAIEGPLQGTGYSFEAGVHAALCDELTKVKAETVSGETVEITGEYIEPVQLQVVCRNLWMNLPPAVTVISTNHLKKFGNVEDALRDFYEFAVRNVAMETNIREDALRLWFGHQLITPRGTRGMVCQEREQTGGIPNMAVKKFEDEYHIIRGEMRAGSRWYELTHDRLISPIQIANEELEQRLSTRRVQRKIGKWASVVAAIAAILIYVGYGKHAEYSLSAGQIKELRNLPPIERELRAKNVLDNVAGYLWSKKEFYKLFKLMKQSEDIVPKDYGIEKKAAYLMPYVDSQLEWPLTLKFSPKREINQGQLLYEWRARAVQDIYQWGIPVPIRIQLDEDPNLPVEDMHIISITSTKVSDRMKLDNAPSKPPIKARLSIPSRPGYALITAAKLPQQLRDFFDKHRDEWTQVGVLEYGGPWWLVPPWTQPVWKAAGHDSLPQEAGVATAVANRIINEPELVLTAESVKFLLKRLAREVPETVNEGLIARGGVEGIKNDLIEIIRREKHPLTQLEYLLDLLSENPSLPSDEIAKYATANEGAIFYAPPLKLPRYSLSGKAGLEELKGPESKFQEAYEEIIPWLPPVKNAIRVYLGRSLIEQFTLGDNLSPKLTEALVELRKEFNEQFGFSPPGVRFSPDESLGDNQLRIEILNQGSAHEYAKPIEVRTQEALDILVSQLRLRYWAYRIWWLTPASVDLLLQQLPGNLRQQLEHYYTLTDMKLILRGIIAPTKAEVDKYAQREDQEAFTNVRPEQTLNQLPWLLRSLIFWVSMGKDPLNRELIIGRLHQTQSARFISMGREFPVNQPVELIELIKRGIDKLESGESELAKQIFTSAAAIDREIAYRAFLTLYSFQSKLSLAKQLVALEKRCSLPTPGQISGAPPPIIDARYELETFLSQSGKAVSPETRRKFCLYLLWSYISAKHPKKTATMRDQLLAQQSAERWPPNDLYFLAYLLLDAHKPAVITPAQLGRIEKLLSSAFQSWSDEQAESAFRELLGLYTSTSTPTWYSSILVSLVDLHPQSYWLAYYLGATLARSSREEDANKALALLDRAESNLSKTRPEDRDRQNAWLDWARALAFLTKARYSRGQNRQLACQQAVKFFEHIIIAISPPGSQHWPALDAVYGLLADAYTEANNLAQAAAVMDQGLARFPDSQRLLSSRFFLHMARLETKQALELAQKALAGPYGKKDYVLFIGAVAQFLTGQEEFQYTANQFLNKTTHEYRNYIRMMLYVTLSSQGKKQEAKDLLMIHWRTIDRSSWRERLEQGDSDVWPEMLIGYFKGEVDKEEIFGPLKTPEAFAQSPLRLAGQSFLGLQCEAYFYDALHQGVIGDPASRRERIMGSLNKALATEQLSYYEFHMARYLIGRMNTQQHWPPLGREKPESAYPSLEEGSLGN